MSAIPPKLSTSPVSLRSTGTISTRKKPYASPSTSDNSKAIHRVAFRSLPRSGSAITPPSVPRLDLPPKTHSFSEISISDEEEKWVPKSARTAQEVKGKDKTPRSGSRICWLFQIGSPKREKLSLPPILKQDKQIKEMAKRIKHAFEYKTSSDQPFDPNLVWKEHSLGLFLKVLEYREEGKLIQGQKIKEDLWQEVRSDVSTILYSKLGKLNEILKAKELNQAPRAKDKGEKFVKELSKHVNNLAKADLAGLLTIQHSLVKAFLDDLFKMEVFEPFIRENASASYDQELSEIHELANSFYELVDSLSAIPLQTTERMVFSEIGSKEIRSTYTEGKKEEHFSTLLLETREGDISSVKFEEFDGYQRKGIWEKGSSRLKLSCRYTERNDFAPFYRFLIEAFAKGGVTDNLADREINELIYHFLLGKTKHTFFIPPNADETSIRLGYPLIPLLQSTTHVLLDNSISHFEQDHPKLFKDFHADFDLASKEVKITAVEHGFITEQSIHLRVSQKESYLKFRLSFSFHFNSKNESWHFPRPAIKLVRDDIVERYQNPSFSLSELKKIIGDFIVVMSDDLNNRERPSPREQEISRDYTPESSIHGPSLDGSDTDSVHGSAEAESDEETHDG